MSGGLGKQLEWLKKVTNKLFESKHVMMGQSSDLAKSIVTLDRRISYVGNLESCISQIQGTVSFLWRHCIYHKTKSVATPAVKENDKDAQLGEENCSWRSMQMDTAKQEPSGDEMSEEEAWVYRSTVARLNNWAVDRPDMQHAVRVCSKSAANPTTHDWLKLKPIGRNVTGCPKHQNHVCLAKGTTNV